MNKNLDRINTGTREPDTDNRTMSLVFAGHVDHGKSTIVGRLLADTGSLPEGKLEQVKRNCELNSRPFEYAFLIDALKDEQSQGITIDSARVFFRTGKRHYIIIDAPGHIEFLKNMITGAARAEAALLVIDAEEGVRENSRRHGYMLSMLGIRQIAVLVNKMDLVDYKEDVYRNIVSEYTRFLNEIGVEPRCFVPVSGMNGDNVTPEINAMSWYSGKSVLDVLDDFRSEPDTAERPFRMPVQDVYKFTRFGDSRRIVAGTIESGSISVGDEVIFYPSGKKSRIKTMEAFNAEPGTSAAAPYPASFTLEEQIYITRGQVAVKSIEPAPRVSTNVRVSLFWLGRKPMIKKKEYIFKIGTVKVPARLGNIERIIDASDLEVDEVSDRIERHDVAECVLELSRAIAFDPADEHPLTSRFVIVDDYEITGGGIIREDVNDSLSDVRERVFLRNYRWEKSGIPNGRRAERYNQRATLIVITGKKDAGKKPLARALERLLFDDGRFVYFLGIGNVLYGVDSDIRDSKAEDHAGEHIRRMAEVANIMLEAGMILIVTAIDLGLHDLNIIRTVISPDHIETVLVGDDTGRNISYDIYIDPSEGPEQGAARVRESLQEKGIIFRAW